MDIATHLLVPYAAALAAFGYWRKGGSGDRRRASAAAVVGVAGFAPDLDGLLDGIAEALPDYYWLQHRGVSHTLLFSPLFAFTLVGSLSLLARRWPARFGLFSWRASFVPWAVLGAWSHLMLDAVTLAGVPLWWPFAFGRTAFMLFHWLVIWLLPPAALVLGLHAFGKLDRRRLVQAGAALALVLVVLAGWRLAERPDMEEALVFPRDSAREWLVVRQAANESHHAALWRDGNLHDDMWFEPAEPAAAASAIGRARDTGGYKGFLMGSYGPEVVQAAREGDAWRVRFTDVAQRYEALHEPRWTPTTPFEDWGYVEFLVDEASVTLTHRGW